MYECCHCYTPFIIGTKPSHCLACSLAYVPCKGCITLERLCNNTMVNVTFKTLNGRQLNTTVSLYASVISIKKDIEYFTCFEKESVQLIFAGRVLADDYTFAHYDIKDGSFIHVVLNLRGD